MVAALGGVEHQQFEKLREWVGGLLASEKCPVESVDLLVESVMAYISRDEDLLHLILRQIELFLALLDLFLQSQHSRGELLMLDVILIGDDTFLLR